jgi:hypothetical protein
MSTVKKINLPGGALFPCRICGGEAVMEETSGVNLQDLEIRCTNPECPFPQGVLERYSGQVVSIGYEFKRPRQLIAEWNAENNKSLDRVL